MEVYFTETFSLYISDLFTEYLREFCIRVYMCVGFLCMRSIQFCLIIAFFLFGCSDKSVPESKRDVDDESEKLNMDRDTDRSEPMAPDIVSLTYQTAHLDPLVDGRGTALAVSHIASPIGNKASPSIVGPPHFSSTENKAFMAPIVDPPIASPVGSQASSLSSSIVPDSVEIKESESTVSKIVESLPKVENSEADVKVAEAARSLESKIASGAWKFPGLDSVTSEYSGPAVVTLMLVASMVPGVVMFPRLLRLAIIVPYFGKFVLDGIKNSGYLGAQAVAIATQLAEKATDREIELEAKLAVSRLPNFATKKEASDALKSTIEKLKAEKAANQKWYLGYYVNKWVSSTDDPNQSWFVGYYALRTIRRNFVSLVKARIVANLALTILQKAGFDNPYINLCLRSVAVVPFFAAGIIAVLKMSGFLGATAVQEAKILADDDDTDDDDTDES